MKKTLLCAVATLVLSLFASTAQAETETKALLDVDFAGGIPEGWTVGGDVQVVDGAAQVAAGKENYLLSPELDLSVAGEVGLFRITKLRASLTPADNLGGWRADVVEKLKVLAEDCDRSLSQYINLICKAHLKQLEK